MQLSSEGSGAGPCLGNGGQLDKASRRHSRTVCHVADQASPWGLNTYCCCSGKGHPISLFLWVKTVSAWCAEGDIIIIIISIKGL